MSRETLRRILRDGGVSWQTTTTWKASTDPDFTAKMRRILDLYDHPPEDGRVVCVDEFGPLNLLPRKGKAWRPRGKPRRLRATYDRHDGVMHMLAALDLATGKLLYRIRERKRSIEFLALLKVLRARWPGEKLYVICDNFSPHRHARVRTWCTAHGRGRGGPSRGRGGRSAVGARAGRRTAGRYRPDTRHLPRARGPVRGAGVRPRPRWHLPGVDSCVLGGGLR